MGAFFIGIKMIAKIHENLPIELNECVKCHWALPLSEFRKDRNKRNGLKSWCKRCAHLLTDKKRERDRARYKLNPQSYQNRSKKWRAKNPTYRWEKHILNTYKLTEAEYQAVLLKQEGKCAICGISQTKLSHILCVDHCHTTGRIRGLLCKTCNLGIGNLRDNIHILKNAIKYLEQ